MIGKPEELWESLKFLGLPNKTVISNFTVSEDSSSLTLGTCSV